MNLTIRSEQGVLLTFHSRIVREDGWVQAYLVTTEARGFRASMEVHNPPYGVTPTSLFTEIAAEWSGWLGLKEWRALDGEFGLSASADKTGHVTLVAELRSMSAPCHWESKLSLVVEAGTLETLAEQARAFFDLQVSRDGA